jgi:hypothetical protein
MSIALSTRLHTSFADAITGTRDALAQQGFGVLTDLADDESVIVDAMNPQILVEVTGEPGLREIADQVTTKMQAAIDSLPATVSHW